VRHIMNLWGWAARRATTMASTVPLVIYTRSPLRSPVASSIVAFVAASTSVIAAGCLFGRGAVLLPRSWLRRGAGMALRGVIFGSSVIQLTLRSPSQGAFYGNDTLIERQLCTKFGLQLLSQP
jgi:hypothetical protein